MNTLPNRPSLLLSLILVVLTGCATKGTHQPQTTSNNSSGERGAVTDDYLALKRESIKLENRVNTIEQESKEVDDQLAAKKRELEDLSLNRTPIQDSNAKTLQTEIAQNQESIANNQRTLILEQAKLNAERLKKVAELQAQLEKESADKRAQFTIQVAKIEAENEIASAKLKTTEIDKTAKVVAPIVMGDKVYASGKQSSSSAASSKPSQEDTNKKITAVTQGQATAVIVETPSRVIYDVFFQFSDKDTYREMTKLLKQYSIKSFWTAEKPQEGVYTIFLGRYYRFDDALTRKKEVMEKTYQENVQIKQTVVKKTPE